MNDPGRSRYPEIYRPLAPGFTRVFELEPGEVSDPIVGRLVPQAINGEQYEALSYVWGNQQKHREIIINRVTLSVTENLHGARTAFRHRPLFSSGDGSHPGLGPARRQVRRLWADAVCINQGAMPERISQVEQMACIYASARRVLAWLGWEDGEEGRQHTRDAIRFIHSFMKDPVTGLRDARILYHDLGGPARHLAVFLETYRCQFEEQTRKWEAVKFFFEIEYFHRTWIVQELGLARETIMYTALKPTGGAEGDKHTGSKEVAKGIDGDLVLDSIDWPLVGEFVKFLDYSGASLVAQLGLLSWVAHHILMVWEMREDGTPNCDFLTGLHWTRILRVTDARDRVYGLLGHPMSVINGDLVIKPNYTHTRGVIYTKLAASFIQKTKNLYVVSLVDHEDDQSVEAREWDPQDESKLPSWVPDWHSINRTTPLDYPIAAAHIEDAEIRIEGETEGAEGTPMPHLLTRGSVVDEISAVSRRMETTDFPVTHLARERAKENPFWLDRVWELVFPADDPAERDALAVLETLSLALPLGTREKDQLVSKAGSNQTLEEYHRSFAAYVLEYHELWCRASQASVTDNNNNSYLPARSLFDSLPAGVQAELRRRAEGATSEGFIECITWPCMCRVVYRTMSGCVGIDQGTTTAMGTDAAPSISCVHIDPTIMPARMKSGVVDGREFGEKVVHFRIV
ncbi:unnamed protein product [Fusarium equiseti]|uniref:Heterokaryon incompatibility domain-containing protein n=1 Tax=Fusarium equiseti TaxID=61235 RepID=A0A8J2IQN1_FUSEQ|nr:unnamed protein product [Fusarium equiseti]